MNKNINILIWLFLTLYLGLGTFSYAQEESEINNQLWFDYFFYYLPKEGLQVTGDLSYRTRLVSNEWDQYVARGNFLYQYEPWLGLYGGLGLFFTAQKVITNTLEIRPWAGASFSVNVDFIRNIRIKNLTRLEVRFVINTQTSGNTIDPRLRNRTDARIPINNFLFVDNTLYARLEIEFFTSTLNIKEQISDRIRIAAGVGFKFNYQWRVEFNYYVQRGKNTAEEEFTITDNIWRLIVRHYLD